MRRWVGLLISWIALPGLLWGLSWLTLARRRPPDERLFLEVALRHEHPAFMDDDGGCDDGGLILLGRPGIDQHHPIGGIEGFGDLQGAELV